MKWTGAALAAGAAAAGGMFADNWGEIGDLNFGAVLTLGAALMTTSVYT